MSAVPESPSSGAAAGGFFKGPLGVVFLTVFLDLVGFGILIPISPFYAESFGARPSTITLLSATFSLMQFLFAPMLGRLSDRIGRRPVMLATIALNATGYIVFGLSSNMAWLFASRIASGLGSANLGTAQAIIADVTTPETRAKGMGLIGAAFGMGFILGPVIGGVFSQFGLAVPAFVAASLSTINFIQAWFQLPETRTRVITSSATVSADGRTPEGRVPTVPSDRSATASASQPTGPTRLPTARYPAFSFELLRSAIERPNVSQLLWLYFVGTIAFSLMEQSLALYIEHTWVPRGADANTTSHLLEAAAKTTWFLVCVGFTAAVTQGLLIGRLVKALGERRLVQLGVFLTMTGIALLPTAGMTQVFGLFMAVGPVIALGSGITQPSTSSLLSQSVDPRDFGGILGLGQSFSALGRIVGPLMAGTLFERAPSMPFWVGASLSATCVAVALTMRPTPARRSTAS